MDDFDRNNPGEFLEKVEIDIAPFGTIEFDERGRVKVPAEHADFLEWVNEQLDQVPYGFTGFIIDNGGRKLHFDSLGQLVRFETIQCA